MTIANMLARQLPATSRAALVAAAILAVVLAGCGDKGKQDRPATQTAAKVNKEEITVHQINFALQQQRALPPEQAASASKLVLERLVDQELALQKAHEQKLDRDPRVVQQLEAARREVVARAYVEKISNGAPKPSPEEIKQYYDANPALFSERRIYNLQELSIEAKPEQIPELRAKLQAAKEANEFINFLKVGEFKFAGNQAVRAAEQLPLANLKQFAGMKDGQALFNMTPSGAQVLILLGSRSQSVDEARARPAIEQFLLNERKRKMVEDDLKALRADAKIEYLGEFANGPAAGAASELPEVKPAPPVGAPASAATPEPVRSLDSASSPSNTALEKGLQGLK